jgi:thiamine-monophosphate kinase
VPPRRQKGSGSNSLTGEDRLLAWLRDRLGEPLLGDDAAILPAASYAVTVDSQIEGVHFVPGLDPAIAARRLLAVNLSDLAATGAVPAYAFLALSAAPGFDHRRFFVAFAAACRRYGVRLAGGDLARSPGGTVLTLTLHGTRPDGGRWLRRDDARPGHALWLGGTVGESAAGALLVAQGARLQGARIELPALPEDRGLLTAARHAVRRHLQPEPQLALGRWLGEQTAGAAIDISDGLARDLHRLCRESRTGAVIESTALPLADRFEPLCAQIGVDSTALALGGGEDYVLLFTLPPEVEPPARFGCSRIGTITGGRRLVVQHDVQQDGGTHDLPAAGWDHLTERK